MDNTGVVLISPASQNTLNTIATNKNHNQWLALNNWQYPNLQSDEATQQFSNLLSAPVFGIYAPQNVAGGSDSVEALSPTDIAAANESMQAIGATGIYDVYQAGLASNQTVDTELNYITGVMRNTYEYGINAMSSALSNEDSGGFLGILGL